MIDASIIVPVYNTDQTLLKQCINSIVKAASHSTIEIVLVDDGSKQECAEHVDRLMDEISCLRVIHQSNKGEGGARNTGIEKANGHYLLFVDSDDIIPEGWIDLAIEKGRKTNADIVSGRFLQCIQPPESTNTTYDEVLLNEDEVYKIQRDQFLETTNLVSGLEYIDRGVCSKLYKRSLITNFRFREGVVLSTDQIYNHEVLRRCKTYCLTNKDSYFYITNPNSVSHVYRENAVDVMMNSLMDVKENLFDNPEVKNAFYFHVLRDLRLALQFSCFNNPQKTSFIAKYKKVKKAFTNGLVVEAQNKLQIKNIKTKTAKIFIFLMKHNLPFLYTAVHLMTCQIKRFRRKNVK